LLPGFGSLKGGSLGRETETSTPSHSASASLHGADWRVSKELAEQFERKAGRTKVEGLRLGSAGGGSNGGHETEKGCQGEEGSWGNGGGSGG
jgi:hypothetical protein